MRILQISYKKDERGLETNKICNILGDTYHIYASQEENTKIEKNYAVYQKKGWRSYFSFIRFVKKILKMYGPFDMVLADNRAALIPAYFAKNKAHAKVLAYDAYELYNYKDVKHLRGKIGCLVEKILVPKFNVITCANSYRAELMKRQFNLHFFPITYENIRKLSASDEEIEKSDAKFKTLFESEKIDIITTSGLLLERKIDLLADAVCRLGNNYRLFIVGFEDEQGKTVVESIQKKYGVDNIVIIPWVSKADLKYLVDKCKIAIVNYSLEGTNNTYCASGKLYEFAFEGLPVVTTENPPLKYLCEKYEIGEADNHFYQGICKVVQNYEKYKKNICIFAESINVEGNNGLVANAIAKRIECILQ